jgi:hypothetical protein
MSVIAIGFFDTPDKFWAACTSLDASVQKLRAAVDAAPDARGINTAWREQFGAFVRRWELERDQYEPYAARLFLTVPNQRLQQFKEAYLWWAGDFERKARRAVPGKDPPPKQGQDGSIVPDQLWWIVGAGVVVYALAKGWRW